MPLMFKLDPVVKHCSAERVRSEVNVWTAGGSVISSTAARTSASHLWERRGDALDEFQWHREVDLDAMQFQLLNLLRGPVRDHQERLKILALMAWVTQRYAREIRLVQLRVAARRDAVN